MVFARRVQATDLAGLELAQAAARAGVAAGSREAVGQDLGRCVLLTGLDAAERASLAGLVASVDGCVLLGDGGPRGDGRLLAGNAAALGAVEKAAPPRVAQALAALHGAVDARRVLEVRGLRFELGQRPLVMGILNVTPDSFSDGGAYDTPAAATTHGRRLAELGAAWIDVGGESTRPGAAAVDEAVEAARVLPVVRALAAALPSHLVCVDTSKASVAERALAAGARLVNDVTALGDPRMAEVVAASGAALCLMHMRGEPRTMQKDPVYGDVLEEILEALGAARERALRAGVRADRLLVDPGFGFGKTVEHNYFLLRHLGALRVLGAPVVIGTSRKSTLGAVTGRTAPAERLAASVASAAIAAVLGGADVVRAHDVAETCDALAVAQAVLDAGRGAGGGVDLDAWAEARGAGAATAHEIATGDTQHVGSAKI